MDACKEERRAEPVGERRLEIENRMKNLFWTVSGDYGADFAPDMDAFAWTGRAALYEVIKQGAFARYYDQGRLEFYLRKKLYLSADEEKLLGLTGLCVDAAVYPALQKERLGTEDIRKEAFKERLAEMEKGPTTQLLEQIRNLYMRRALKETPCGTKEADRAVEQICFLANAQETEEIISTIDSIYDHILDPSFESRHGALARITQAPEMKLAKDAWQECLTDEQMDAIIQKYRSSLQKKMMRLKIKNKKSFSLTDKTEVKEIETEKFDPRAIKRIREYVELNYGKSYLDERAQERFNQKFCTGIHTDCILYLTEGILQNPVIKNNQYRFAQLQYEKNQMYYGNNHWIIKRNIAQLADALKRAFLLRSDENASRARAGRLVPNRLWKVARTKDDKLFDAVKKSENSAFVVDVLLDSSGSQAKRQAQVATQGYMISEALSEAGIPHRVTGYCAFWGYTVLQRFRDYEDTQEANSRIFQFRAYANNRDGLALKVIRTSLMERTEENKILIVLSDGKPCDMSIERKGTRQPAVYDGEDAVKDTAYEIRRARGQGISVLGIFVGSEEELSVERRIFGKDFAYIRNIQNFSWIVGAYLRRQIDA